MGTLFNGRIECPLADKLLNSLNVYLTSFLNNLSCVWRIWVLNRLGSSPAGVHR